MVETLNLFLNPSPLLEQRYSVGLDLAPPCSPEDTLVHGVHRGAQGTPEGLAELRHVGQRANDTESVGAVAVFL
jgi:hypothetical protein